MCRSSTIDRVISHYMHTQCPTMHRKNEHALTSIAIYTALTWLCQSLCVWNKDACFGSHRAKVGDTISSLKRTKWVFPVLSNQTVPCPGPHALGTGRKRSTCRADAHAIPTVQIHMSLTTPKTHTQKPKTTIYTGHTDWADAQGTVRFALSHTADCCQGRQLHSFVSEHNWVLAG